MDYFTSWLIYRLFWSFLRLFNITKENYVVSFFTCDYNLPSNDLRNNKYIKIVQKNAILKKF